MTSKTPPRKCQGLFATQLLHFERATPMRPWDPNLSSKPPQTRGKRISGYWKEGWLKRMDKDSAPRLLVTLSSHFLPKLGPGPGSGQQHSGGASRSSWPKPLRGPPSSRDIFGSCRLSCLSRGSMGPQNRCCFSSALFFFFLFFVLLFFSWQMFHFEANGPIGWFHAHDRKWTQRST